jgi:hypothetical protein
VLPQWVVAGTLMGVGIILVLLTTLPSISGQVLLPLRLGFIERVVEIEQVRLFIANPQVVHLQILLCFLAQVMMA